MSFMLWLVSFVCAGVALRFAEFLDFSQTSINWVFLTVIFYSDLLNRGEDE